MAQPVPALFARTAGARMAGTRVALPIKGNAALSRTFILTPTAPSPALPMTRLPLLVPQWQTGTRTEAAFVQTE